MCGIVGLVYKDQAHPCEQEVIVRMRDLVAYRGPDDCGAFFDGNVGLGHRRLSIIDLGGGHQPMADQRRNLQIIFNGEIYNYREIREELRKKGYTFQTESDTEVILHLYTDRGEDCVHALNGMFAFAIWDAAERTLFLARDRMGVKPLYYADLPQGFVFGSEIKSIFASGLVTPQCREEALGEYVMFRQVAGTETLFRGVKSLAPGCRMTIRDGQCRISRYWSPIPEAPPAPMAFDDAVRTLGSLLDDAVRLRLISDVPVGTFCSGGVDSSLVTALAAKLKGDAVNTFSVGFDEADYDESPYALMVSKHCRTTHHQLNVSHREFDDLFPTMVWHNDEPLDFANSVHIFALSKMAKRHVTVVLTGEGSDELFAGYPRYRIPDLAQAYRFVPAPMRQLFDSLFHDHRLAKLNRYAALPPDDVLLYNSSYQAQEAVNGLGPRLFTTEYRQDRLSATKELGLDRVSRLSLLDQETFLVSILHRQDKMSMAAGIESRVPFMDYRIAEFANRLPTACKIRRGSGKAVVKALARTVLPAPIVDRRKSGFGVPLAKWFRSSEGMGARVDDLANGQSSDGLDRTVLRRLVAEHRDGSRDHSEILWTAVNLATWRQAYKC